MYSRLHYSGGVSVHFLTLLGHLHRLEVCRVYFNYLIFVDRTQSQSICVKSREQICAYILWHFCVCKTRLVDFISKTKENPQTNGGKWVVGDEECGWKDLPLLGQTIRDVYNGECPALD